MSSTAHPSLAQSPSISPIHSKAKVSVSSRLSDVLFDGHTRFVVLALTTVCLTLGMCNGAALHFTVICMVGEQRAEEGNSTTNDNDNNDNTSSPFYVRPQPMFSFGQQGWLFSALALGTLLGSLPLTPLCRLIGFRRVFTLYGLLGGLGTLATPGTSTLLPQPFNFGAVYAIRIFQGLILATSFVATEKISKNWSPLKELTLFISIISCHLPLGRLITLPLAGFLCQSPLGWPSIYYLLGALTVLSFGLFFCLFRGSPHSHQKVSRAEIAVIEYGKVKQHLNSVQMRQVPQLSYAQLLSNPHVWALFASSTGISLGIQLFGQYGPIYLKSIGLSTERTGLVSALPFLLYALISVVAGRLCDRFVGEHRLKASIVVFTSGTQYFMATCLVVLAILPGDSVLLIQCFYIAVIVFVGLWVIGIIKQTRLIEPTHAQALNAVNTFIIYFVAMILPCLVNLFVSQDADGSAAEQWSRLFMFVAIVHILTGVVSQISVTMVKN